MKVKFLSILAALALFAACENPFVTDILPDRNGGDDNVPPGSFVVTFNRNGGDTDADPTTKVVTPPATTIDDLPAPPTRAAHTFTGWNTQADGSGTVFSAATTVTADITVYAEWLYVPEGSFVVTFDRNGGDTDADPVSKVVTPPATTIDELPTAPVRDGYTFEGWNTAADGSGDTFTVATEVTAAITVYAQWQEVPEGSFIVTFNKNGGDTDADPPSKVVTPPATTIDSLPTPPTWANHTFAGWNTQADGSGTAFTASTTVSADIIVYAKWTQEGTPQTPPVVVDFEQDAIGKTYESTGGYENDQPVSPTVRVVADPANAGQKSMEISSTGYNQAAIIPITLPAGQTLNDAESFSFRIRLTSGTISYKEVQVYAASSPATFVHGGFGNPANSQYAQFAANKLGETETIPELTLNQWHDYSISISGLNNTLSNLSGTIYLAIGIQHDTDEAITYLLDDLTFTFGNPLPPVEPGAPVKVDFENDAINKTYGYAEGNNAPTSVKVVADPAPAGGSTKSLEFTGTSGYNQAAVIPINLPGALNTYRSFTFRFNMKTGSLENKDMMVYVADSANKFTQYGFGNPSTDNYNFANLLLGQARLTDVKNQWDTYAIAIENPGSAISNLSGNVFIAIGINHNDGIVYYLDDLTFSSDEPPPPAAFPTLVTFEDDAIGKTYGATRGNNSPEVTVRADPASLALSTKSLRIVTNGGSNSTSGYNQAVIIPINLPDGNLSEYRSFRFKFYYTGGALLDPQNQHRKINAYVSDSTGTFIQYGFGNPSGNQYQFADNLLGEVEPDYGETQWMDYAINFTAGSAISGLSGNVYVAIGINHDKAVTYYLDDLTFSKQELQKQPGAALSGTLTVSGITASSVDITAGSVTVPDGSTQTIEYSVSPTSAGSPGVWQTTTHFSGLTSETSYTAYARSAANAFYNAGPEKTATFTTLGKADGAAVTAPTLASNTHNRIVINVVNPPGNGQTVEYAISTGTTEPATGWQTGTIFTRLSPSTGYYVFARAMENDDYKAGAAVASAQITTNAGPTPNPNVPAFIIDFENDAVGKTYNATNAAGGNPDVKVISDPSYPSQRSLQITTSGDNAWNRGAIIPINLPFELQNYQSFTFRFYLISGSNIVNNISVYLKSDSNYASGGFGNGPDSSYTKFPELLVGDVTPDYSLTNQWVEYEIDIDAEALNAAIKTLSGNVYLAIGINHGNALTYMFDDLTFNAVHDFTPPPSLSPTSATFVKADAADIDVTIYPYGRTLSSISGGSPAIASGDYTVTDIDSYRKKVTLSNTYLSTQNVGDLTLAFNFSGEASSNITITIVSSAAELAVTSYDFKTNPSITPAYNGTGLSAVVKTGSQGFTVLEVTKTAGYSTTILILPFDLGTKTLADYSSIEVKMKFVSGDLNNTKTFRVEVQPNGTAFAAPTNNGTVTTNPIFGSISTNLTTGSLNTLNVSSSGGASSLGGKINIGFLFVHTNPYVYEIESIVLK